MKLLVNIAVVLSFALAGTATATAESVGLRRELRQPKAGICHKKGDDGTYKKIEVAGSTWETHFDHGDGFLWEEVPDIPGFIFDDECNVIPMPSASPSVAPSVSPSVSPRATPSVSPSVSPTISPSDSPTVSRTPSPTDSPDLSVCTVGEDGGITCPIARLTTLKCSDSGSDCCAGHAACVWDEDTTVTVYPGSCNGEYACDYIGYLSQITIGRGSCIGDNACSGARENIGKDSCIGDDACYSMYGSVGDSSCQEDSACYFSGEVGNNSCNGYLACDNTFGVGNNSCNSDSACDDAGIVESGVATCDEDSDCLSLKMRTSQFSNNVSVANTIAS